MGKFEELIHQVDQFIRKYYKNQMIKGFFLFSIIFLSTFLLVSGLEFIGQFNSFIRAFLFFSFIGLNLYVLTKYFIIPLLKLYSFGERINRFQAAKIIGEFFPDINDKLLNTLQLNESLDDEILNLAFVKASVQQNAEKLNTFSFTSAIDYSANKKFLSYFIPILLVVILTGVLFPKLYRDGTTRVMKFNQVFEYAPDFKFELLNDELLIEEGGSKKIEVKLTPEPGKAIPKNVFLVTSEGEFLMRKSSNTQAYFTLENVNKDVKFYFKASNANSDSYDLKVAKRSSIGNLSLSITYPKYLNREAEKIDNPGDLIIPEGSELTWNGIMKNTKELKILTSDTSLVFKDNSGFRYHHRVLSSTPLFFVLENETFNKLDSTQFYIDVIKDEYPSISLDKTEDSLTNNKIYFSGNVSDDHGVSQLIFTYEIKKKTGEVIKEQTTVPGIDGKQSPFSMTFDIRHLPLELEDELSYYFTVYDNDGVNGSKATRSSVYQYSSPSLKELQEKRAEESDKTQEQLEELIRESKEFQEEIHQLKKDILNSQSNAYEQQKQIENLKNQQMDLQDKIEQMKESLKTSFEEKNKLDPADERLLEKQMMLEQMFEELMDDELFDLLKQLEDLINQNLDKDLLEKFEDAEMSAEELEKQLDRTMEMLKKMDVEQRVEDLQNNLEELAKEQEQLKDDFKDGDLSKEEALDKQEELNEKFEQLKDDLDKMLEKNEELNRPLSFDGLDELTKEISQDMQDAKDNIEQGNQQGAQDKQEDAGDKMEQAAAQLQAQMQQSQEDQMEEDIESLRYLLGNLIKMSFDQEENMIDYSGTDVYDPYFVTLGSDQRNIIDNMIPVKDSLRALAKRIPEISSFVEQELREIDKQYKYIPGHIGEREKRQLLTKQQFVMTHLNNLALFLNESLENKQQQMMNMPGGGDGDCDAPGDGEGGGTPGKKGKGDGDGDGGLDQMKEMLKKQLEQLQNGSQPGGNEPGGQQGLIPMQSQQAAKMAAEQSAMQKKIEELREKLNQDGSGDGNQLNDLLKELEKQQEDLINKNWNQELIDRQQEILTRLLESEKALTERGWDEERESNEGKDENYGNQIEFLEYKKQKEKQIELLRTLDPAFSKYYREKANAYFLEIN